MREDRVRALTFGYPGDRGHIGRQRDGRERALADDHRVDELDRYMLGVRARAAGAEHDELAAPVEADRHGMTGSGYGGRLPCQLPGGIAAELEQAADLGVVVGSRRRHCGHSSTVGHLWGGV